MDPLLRLHHVSRTYPGIAPVEALKPVSIDVAAGALLSITGRSGSGKSTLLNVVGLLDRPTSGEYYVDGDDTATLTESELTGLRAWCFGFVFQQFHLLPRRTAVENVEFSLMYQGVPRRTRRRKAQEAIERVGLGHRRDAVPPQLSGGERQRVAIARAVCQEPRVLLCDEPTGNLDQRNSDNIVELLLELNRCGLAVIIVTHDESIARQATDRFVIHDGVASRVA